MFKQQKIMVEGIQVRLDPDYNFLSIDYLLKKGFLLNDDSPR